MLRSHVADLFTAALCKEHGNLEANARLIASAPDLLSALQRIESALEHDPELYSDILSVARGAIAKAKGEA